MKEPCWLPRTWQPADPAPVLRRVQFHAIALPHDRLTPLAGPIETRPNFCCGRFVPSVNRDAIGYAGQRDGTTTTEKVTAGHCV